MKKENYVDGLLYELRNPQYDENGQIISTEISARSSDWNSYSDSSERMMNRICHHLDANLVPDYCPLDEHIGVDEERRTFVRDLLFSAENRNQ